MKGIILASSKCVAQYISISVWSSSLKHGASESVASLFLKDYLSGRCKVVYRLFTFVPQHVLTRLMFAFDNSFKMSVNRSSFIVRSSTPRKTALLQ